jgi:hypothetical protein
MRQGKIKSKKLGVRATVTSVCPRCFKALQTIEILENHWNVIGVRKDCQCKPKQIEVKSLSVEILNQPLDKGVRKDYT